MIKLKIDQSEEHSEIEIIIKCPYIDKKIEDVITLINAQYSYIIGKEESKSYQINVNNIYYIESIDDKTFIYLENKVLENTLRLYELEEKLKDLSFLRISKSCIINIDKLDSVKALINGKYEANLLNGEKVIISRHYVSNFKEKFGL